MRSYLMLTEYREAALTTSYEHVYEAGPRR